MTELTYIFSVNSKKFGEWSK